MPRMSVRGVSINYEVHGAEGPWVALSPGGQRGLDGVRTLAMRVASAGYRVLIHDRRNCGFSDMAFDGTQSEYEIWADDLHEILTMLKATPSWIGGSSSGCRLSLLYALRYPKDVLGLLLWRVTGGPFAVQRLSENYYGKYISAAQAGGMAAVCETDHYKERVEARPENRETLMQVDPKRFIEVMSRWREYFLRSADTPVIGATEEQLRTLRFPACIIPGNDNTHPRRVGEALHRLVGGSELHIMYPEHQDIDLVPGDEWLPREGEMASIFINFMNGARARAAA
jgi:pimeloyl-ACP methyl ester carboxylesterase